MEWINDLAGKEGTMSQGTMAVQTWQQKALKTGWKRDQLVLSEAEMLVLTGRWSRQGGLDQW